MNAETRKESAAILPGGQGCFLSPPDHPEYFQHVETDLHRRRDDRSSMSISSAAECDYISDATRERCRKLLEQWAREKLPEDNERVEAWVKNVYQHMGRCYEDPTREKYGKPETLIWPPSDLDVNLALIDAGFIDKEPPCGECCQNCGHARRLTEARAAKAAEIRAKWEKIATPERHLAFLYVRRYYPAHRPRLDLIANPPTLRGHWYGTEKTRPSAEACPGDVSVRLKHPTDGWCQWCGRDSSPKEAA